MTTQDAVRKGVVQAESNKRGVAFLFFTVIAVAVITGLSHESWAAGFVSLVVTGWLTVVASTDKNIRIVYAFLMGGLWAYWGWGLAQWLGPTVGTILVLCLFGFGSALGQAGTIYTDDYGDGEKGLKPIETVQNVIIQVLGLSFVTYLYIWGFSWPTW